MSLTVTENCPICGGPMYTYCSVDSESSESGKVISKTICSNCGYEKPALIYYTYATGGSDFAVGSTYFNPYNTLTINADVIKLYHKSLNLTVDINDDMLKNIESLEINGFKFIRFK